MDDASARGARLALGAFQVAVLGTRVSRWGLVSFRVAPDFFQPCRAIWDTHGELVKCIVRCEGLEYAWSSCPRGRARKRDRARLDTQRPAPEESSPVWSARLRHFASPHRIHCFCCFLASIRTDFKIEYTVGIAPSRHTNSKASSSMARGNQRDKAREKAQKAAASVVS